MEEWDHVGDGFGATPVRGKTSPKLEGFTNVASAMFGSGIYALFRGGELVYIGKARLILTRIYTHHLMMKKKQAGKPLPRNGWASKVKAITFTDVLMMPCALSDLDRIERQLIARYQPKNNTNLIPKEKVTFEQIGFDLTRLGVDVVKTTPTFVRRF